jgi:sigma-B regulation protein RsbU (phosphoserine phosphatase)
MSDYQIKVMLIDDQLLIAKGVEKILSLDKSIEFHYCKNPLKALDEAIAFKPTVILQDLMMPEMDGLTLVEQLKKHEFTKHIPLIVLSSKEEAEMKAECFSKGVNDYLVKLLEPIELLARIRYHSDSYIRLLQRDDAFKKLKESQDKLQKELDEAASYVKSLLPPSIKSDKINADWIYIPSMSLGGDVFNYEWLDKDNFAVYILDVCGHGVGAAMLSISILNTLRGKTLNADFSKPHTVLKALNEAFPMEEHQDMFFTLFYGVIDLKNKRLSYSSGGHPPQLVIDLETKQFQLIRTDGIALGVEKGADYQTDQVFLPQRSRLLLFSDGTFEIRQPDQKMRPFSDFIQLVTASRLEQVISLVGNPPFDDDFSIIEIKTTL